MCFYWLADRSHYGKCGGMARDGSWREGDNCGSFTARQIGGVEVAISFSSFGWGHKGTLRGGEVPSVEC